MSLEAERKKVYDLLNDRMYHIAENQRKYVWTKNNWREFLDDIELVYAEKTNSHFIGSVVLKKELFDDGVRNHFSIIDGQQRISTLTIMLCVISYIFIENRAIPYFKGLRKSLLVEDNKAQSFPIMSTYANKYIAKLVECLFDNANMYLENKEQLLSVEDLMKKSNATKAVKECFEFFYTEFTEKVGKDMEKLLKYRELINDIRYIDIVAEEDEDAYTIFEVLNARGQALTDFELLRNFILRYSSVEKKDDVKEKLKKLEDLLGSDIEIFLKHYVMHKYGEKTDKNEKRPYKIISLKEKTRGVEAALDDLLLKASYYKKMTTYDDCTPIEKKIFMFFKPRRQQQFRPLVMGMMHQKDKGNLLKEDYEKYLEFLFEFFICYHLIGEQKSNKLEDIVYGYSKKIENEFSDRILERFRKAMADRIPSKDNFCNSIKRVRYSNKFKAYSSSTKRENVCAILELVERELGYEGSFEDLTIEHCMPDSATEANAHIGNLILLEKDINHDECKKKPLSEKVHIYRNSNLKYPHIICDEINDEEKNNFEYRSNRIAEILYTRIKNIKEITAELNIKS